MNRRTLSPKDKWILWGIPALFALGTLFHFLYDILGGGPAIGVIAPVNESVWEHGKLILWPEAIWWGLGFWLWKSTPGPGAARRWFSGALASLVTALTCIWMLYYFYTQAFGQELLWVDILILPAAAWLGQCLGLHVWRRGRGLSWQVLLAAFLAVFLLFLYFTFYPPHIPWFQDGPTGGYGLG